MLSQWKSYRQDFLFNWPIVCDWEGEAVGGHAWEQLLSWQVLWMVSSSDWPSVYINGKETYLAMNVMTLSPLPAGFPLVLLLKVSYKGGLVFWGQGDRPHWGLSSSQSCSYPSPVATPQPQIRTWPCGLPSQKQHVGGAFPSPELAWVSVLSSASFSLVVQWARLKPTTLGQGRPSD